MWMEEEVKEGETFEALGIGDNGTLEIHSQSVVVISEVGRQAQLDTPQGLQEGDVIFFSGEGEPGTTDLQLDSEENILLHFKPYCKQKVYRNTKHAGVWDGAPFATQADHDKQEYDGGYPFSPGLSHLGHWSYSFMITAHGVDLYPGDDLVQQLEQDPKSAIGAPWKSYAYRHHMRPSQIRMIRVFYHHHTQGERETECIGIKLRTANG